MTLLHIAILCILISIVCIEIGLHGIKVVVWVRSGAPFHPSFYRICTCKGYDHTQTRRVGKKRWNVGAIHQVKTGFRKDDRFGSVKILDVTREPLCMITEEDARAEGYDSVREYREIFRKIYGMWKPGLNVWVVDFELVED